MLLARRFLEEYEQPYALATNLQRAAVIDRSNILRKPSKVLQFARQAFQIGQPIGVPHGVRSAIVLVRNLRVEWFHGKPLIFFCESYDYRAVEETILDGDAGHYPDPEQTLISTSCHIPLLDGFYPGRLRLCLNGRPNVHIESFRYELAPPNYASI